MSGADEVMVIHGLPGTPGIAADVQVPGVEFRTPGVPADFPQNATAMGDGSFELKLKYPVTLRFRDGAGQIITENYPKLHLKRLKGRDMRVLRQAGLEDMSAQMIASSTGLPLSKATLVHDEMDAADIADAMRIVRFFTTPGRLTGP